MGGAPAPGAPRPFPRRPGNAEGHRPGSPLARMEPVLEAGASVLPRNLRPQGRAEKGWPGEAQSQRTCWNNVPACLPSRQRRLVPRDGWWEGMLEGMAGLSQGAFFLSTHW